MPDAVPAPATPQPAPPEPGPPRAMGKAVAAGSAWMMISTVATQGGSLAAQYFLALWLSTDDFGIFAIAISVSIFTTFLRDAGIRQLLVQRQKEHDELLGPVFWMGLAFNVATAGLILAAAPVAAVVYERDMVGWVLVVIALSIPLATPAAVLSTRPQIEMRFRELAVIRTVTALIRYAGSVALARVMPEGTGALAFVLPLPVMAAVEWWMTARLNRAKPWRLPAQRARWGGMLRDVGWIIAAGGANAVLNMGNYMVVGLLVPKAAVGVYYFAAQIVIQANVLVATNVWQILFPAFSSMAGQDDRRRWAIRRATRQVALLGAPLGMGLVGTYPALEALLWHGRWAASVPAVVASAALYPIGMVWAVGYASMQAVARYRPLAIAMGVQALGMLAAGGIAAWLARPVNADDPASLARAALFMSAGSSGFYMLSSWALSVWAQRGEGLGAAAFAADVVPPWLMGLLAAGSAYWAAEHACAGQHPLVRLLVGGFTFVALYGVMTRTLMAGALREAVGGLPGRLAGPARRALLLGA